jgi:hypothetical protein
VYSLKKSTPMHTQGGVRLRARVNNAFVGFCMRTSRIIECFLDLIA